MAVQNNFSGKLACIPMRHLKAQLIITYNRNQNPTLSLIMPNFCHRPFGRFCLNTNKPIVPTSSPTLKIPALFFKESASLIKADYQTKTPAVI